MRSRVVIVGAGFGGLECAKALEGSAVDVLLVDRQNYHLFTPLLYQVASSQLNPSDIAYPIRRVFRGSSNVRCRQADIVSFDLDAKRLTTRAGDDISYDYLVLATGSQTNFFGNQDIERRAFGLKNLGEALQLRNHTLSCLERAAQSDDAAEQRRLLTFVIVGGGPTGVEYAGALAELMRLVLPSEYPGIEAAPRIVLVEGAEQLLSAFSERLGSYTRRRLEQLEVEVMLETLVVGLAEGVAELSTGQSIDTHTLVWSAGVQPDALSELLPTAQGSGRVAVDAQLRIEGRSDAFALGDMAAVSHEGRELPMMSAPAMQEGRYVARVIGERLRGGELEVEPFRYVDKGSMATIGRGAAVAAVGKLELSGWLGWLVWLVVHIYYLIGFRNRLVVLWSWAYNYILYDRPVRIITRAKQGDDARLPAAQSGGENL